MPGDVIVQILNQIIFFTSGLCLLQAVGEVFHSKRQPIHYIHAVLLFGNGLIIIRLGLYGNPVLYEHPISFFLFPTSLFLVGPINLIYNHFLIDPGKPIPKKLLLQLVPASIVFLIEAIFLFLPLDIKREFLYELITRPLESNFAIITTLGTLFMFGYTCVMCFEELPLWKTPNAKTEMRLLTVMNLIGLLPPPLCSAGFLTTNVLLIKAGAGITFIIHIIDFLARSRYPDFFQKAVDQIKGGRYTRLLKKGIQPEIVFHRLEELMYSDKIYQDLEMSLESASNLLAIKPHQLSQILNTHYHTTFKDYITKYRIENAKRILLEDSRATILSVCYQVGFNSKSQFNTVFKKMTGKTPKEFRKQPLS